MELEEMKSTWAELSSELDKQKRLTHDIIVKMAHQKSDQSLGKMIRLEQIGGLAMCVVLLSGIAFFLLNGTLNSTPLILFSLMSAAIFTFSGYISYDFISKMKKINLLENSIKETKQHYEDFKTASNAYKKVGIYTMIPTMLFFIPVVLKVFIGKDVFMNFGDSKEKLLEVIITSVLLMIPMFFFMYRFYKKNKKALKEAIDEVGEV